MLAQFILFGLLGIVAQVIISALKSAVFQRDFGLNGQSTLWMFPVYGLVAFIFPIVSFQISDFSWIIRGIIYAIAFFIIEFVFGFILTKLRICPWGYPDKWSLNGLIYIPYAPLWFVLGLCIEWAYPIVIKLSESF